MTFSKLLIVIPTRNRADLAVNAINSVINQKNCNFEILVSDNSTEEREISTLAAFCEKLETNRVKYIRPPHPMAMTEHWDWAMSRALDLSDFSHVTYLTDRTVFLENSLGELQKIVSLYPDKIVSYNFDSIDDSNQPLLLIQKKWTGKLFEINSLFILEIYAKMRGVQALPKMLNCIASRDFIRKSHQLYGYYFASVAPDYNFGFRCLEMNDSIFYYDKSLYVSYGMQKSNGLNVLRGTFQKESTDFMKNLNSTEVCFESPVKFIGIIPNIVMHEYYFAKNAAGSTKFPEMSKADYFMILAEQTFAYGNTEMKREMLEKLRSELGLYLFKYRLSAKIMRRTAGLKIKLHNYFNSSDPYLVVNKFKTLGEALAYACNQPRPASSNYKLNYDTVGSPPSADGRVKIVENYS